MEGPSSCSLFLFHPCCHLRPWTVAGWLQQFHIQDADTGRSRVKKRWSLLAPSSPHAPLNWCGLQTHLNKFLERKRKLPGLVRQIRSGGMGGMGVGDAATLSKRQMCSLKTTLWLYNIATGGKALQGTDSGDKSAHLCKKTSVFF